MNGFLKGALGTIFVLITYAIVISQYSDYQAKAETGNWLAQLKPLQQEIEAAAKEQKSLIGIKKRVNVTEPTHPRPAYFELTDTGSIIMRGGQDGQVILLIPSLVEGRVTWRCIGGSASAIPKHCR